MQEEQGDVLIDVAQTSKAHIKELALLHFDVFSDVKLSDTVSSLLSAIVSNFIINCL